MNTNSIEKQIKIYSDKLDLSQRSACIILAAGQVLQSIFTGEKTDPRFILIANIPDSNFKLFRIQLGP